MIYIRESVLASRCQSNYPAPDSEQQFTVTRTAFDTDLGWAFDIKENIGEETMRAKIEKLKEAAVKEAHRGESDPAFSWKEYLDMTDEEIFYSHVNIHVVHHHT